MIVFYGDGFELNLTNTKVTLVEENPLFYNFFVKNYTYPFSLKIDNETSRKLGFLDLENSGNYNLKYYGKLLIDNDFKESYFIVSSLKNNILEGTVYYGQATVKLLDTNLSELPFSTIHTNSILEHAKEVINKSYPEVSYNFPMVIDDEFKPTKYERFDGIFNRYKNDSFVRNFMKTEDGKEVPVNRNVMTPYPYLMAILKTGFDSVDMVMKGSFVSDEVNNKILVYTDKYLERFESILPSFFCLKKTSEVVVGSTVTATCGKSFYINTISSYTININLNFPNNIEIADFSVKYNDNILFSANDNVVNKKIFLNVKNEDDKGSLELSLSLRKCIDVNSFYGIGNVEKYNSFEFTINDGLVNVFPNDFSLSQIMPDMTFGSLLNRIKNWLSLEITFDKNVVTLNYIEDKFLDIPYIDYSSYEVENPTRIFNNFKAYKLITSNDSFFVTKKGIQNNAVGVRDADITKINMDLEVMPIMSKYGIFTAYKNKDTNAFKLFLYDGLQQGLPVATEFVAGRNFSLREIYSRFWKKWLHFRLNSEIYKDEYLVSVVEPIDINKGIFKYGKKMILKKIRKRRISEEYWKCSIECESL